MAQAKTLLESITSTPSGSSVHTAKTLRQPSFLQNTTASACTMNVDAPHIYALTKTGSTNGNLIQTVPRQLLRTEYSGSNSSTSPPLSIVNSDGTKTDTGANVKVSIGDVKYLEATTDITTSCVLIGTLTTATQVRVTGVAGQAHVDNGGDPLLLDITVADVEGTMTLTEVVVVNSQRDYAVGDTIAFAIPNQDAGVAVTFTAVAGDLGAARKELTELYINSNSSQTINIQAGTRCNVVYATPTPDFDYDFNIPPSVLDLTADVILGSGEITPYEVSTFKCANSATTFTFNSLI